ncbi:hypothetical protein GH714_023040 [Hevea brasiliensis]|uniref:Leucine-rich repeat-containing N-terminal plant-type domain-containing protein n=1 Tax=Hevea brasiliensis TaxID=3981 RepID=A0A6A6N698_HEVBR|nr:hypothetical protein GH714_023040 [Hevea brasiliensis]
MVPFIALTLLSLLSTSCSTSLLNDFNVLVVLKQGFAFPEPVLSTWNSSNPRSVCSWAGVGCSRGRVVSLDLTDLNLSGSVSPQISRLDRLTNLSLAGNNFTGTIEIFRLSNLRFLNISNNQFNGGLDWNYSEMENLEVFDAYNNNFTAFLPLGILSLKKLKYLDLGGNYFYGKIPASYGKLVGLEFYSKGVRQPDQLGNLDLSNNALTELQNNVLSGNLSENGNSSSKPVKLGQLNLSNNLLSGPLPFSLSNFSSLQILLLSGNQFSGPIPTSIGELQQVLMLDLSRNSLSGPIPPEIGNCFHLTFLDMSQNKLSGSVPPEIFNIHILNYLNFSRNHLNQTIPKSIGSMKSLTVADFSFNDFSGKVPESGQFSLFNASSFAGNPQLCGPLLNNPCNFTTITNTPGKAPSDLKLIFALGLICSLIFATAAIIKAKSFKKNSSDSWKMTAFQKLEFTVTDILECVKDGNVLTWAFIDPRLPLEQNLRNASSLIAESVPTGLKSESIRKLAGRDVRKHHCWR